MAIRKRLKSQRLAPKVERHQTSKPTVRLGRYLETFQAIKDYADEHEDCSINSLCRLLGVSRSGYYKWLNHEETDSEKTNQTLMTTIKELHAKYEGILG